MLAVAGTRLGLKTHIYAQDKTCPAADVAHHVSLGDFEDLDQILVFAKACDVVTYEFENVPAVTAKAAASVAPLRPGARALDISQDRLNEKSFLRAQLGLEVAGFEDITSIHDLRRAVRRLGLPCVLKTRRFGYDGKGQVIIRKETEIPPLRCRLCRSVRTAYARGCRMAAGRCPPSTRCGHDKPHRG